jgi:dihydroxy-acid dehydratase
MIAMVHNGDQIEIDIPNRRLELLVNEPELEHRRAAWQPQPVPISGSFLDLYRQVVTQADQGAILKIL